MNKKIFALMVILTPGLACAADWPQWLGPNRNGTSTESVKPWKGTVTPLWRGKVGAGHSSPVVAHGMVYVHEKPAGSNDEQLTIFDAVTGNRIATIPQGDATFSSPFGNGPRATPSVGQDGVIVTHGVAGRVAAHLFRHVKGQPQTEPMWQANTLEKFGANNLTFGISASPLIEGDLVIVLVGGALKSDKEKGGGIAAFHRQSGKLIWHVLDDAASYAAPIAIGPKDARQLLLLTAQGLVALAPKDGAVLWRFPFKDLLAESSTTPILVGDLIIASSVTLGSVAVRINEKNGKLEPEQVWKSALLNSYFTTPVVVGDEMYIVTGKLIPPQSATLRCVNWKTGTVRWSRNNVGKYHASLVRLGDGKILMLEERGDLVLVDPNPTEYRELARAKICGETWAHPALANGKLYVRDDKELLCFDLNP